MHWLASQWRCMDDMHRLKDEHKLANAHILLNNENVVVEEKAKVDSFIQRSKVELSEELRLMKFEFDKMLHYNGKAHAETEKNYDKLVLAFLATIKLVADQKIRVCRLDNRISELETIITQKDERIRRLLQDIARMDESSKMLVLDLKTRHKGDLCDILDKQRNDLSEVHREGAVLVADLQKQQTAELDAFHREMVTAKVQMMEKHGALQKQLDILQERFIQRESRVEDVAHISKLRSKCEQKDVIIMKLNGRINQLQLELNNREETYNKLFGNSPHLVHQGISDWMKPKHKNDGSKLENSKLTGNAKVDKIGKVGVIQVAMLQKRAASVARQAPKLPEHNYPML